MLADTPVRLELQRLDRLELRSCVSLGPLAWPAVARHGQGR